ncbi:efflux RND transporter permease subunit [Rapidithrix thailandica]|uniref:Efflux RND transporter permease subunit n=1 Tax=Rapidithrix thailandica TaxID=413964 RepID=A0AAW9SBI2_9BACT
MVHFLISRPIAVTMTYIALLVLGVVAVMRLPVSLMPDIDIPEITVQISKEGLSARELESSVVRPLRQNLMQVAHLDDIHSETRDGHGIIQLRFDYGTDIDFAFIEVNEKVDRSMNNLPRDMDRPRVVKASASDIPVFYLNLTLKEETAHIRTHNERFPVPQKFAELSNFAGQVIRKRIEQLNEVALVDMSGQVFPELLILPDLSKLEGLGLTLSQLEQSIKRMNLQLGNLLIRDGQYQYNIRFASSLQNKQDIEAIYLKLEGRLLQLKDLAQVIEHPQKRKGLVTANGKNALSLAVIKQSDAQMASLKENLHILVGYFERDYPNIAFEITRDQTLLLDYSIDNLTQSLVWGALFAFVIMFFFLKDFKSPILIGISVPASLIVSLLFFHLVGLSINIISLSGLVLGVGMMIDNSIIVIDNINQQYQRNGKLLNACVQGTNEVFRPLLSSVLTTCAVFIPLIFLSGISGAMFYDQAISITIGLSVSLAVSVTLLPVYFKFFYQKKPHTSTSLSQRIRFLNYERLYEKGFRLTMRHQDMLWGIFLLMLVGCTWLYTQLNKEKLPPVTQQEILLHIDWNERIHLDENNRRTQKLVQQTKKLSLQNTCWVGQQQYLLDRNHELGPSEALVYFKVPQSQDLKTLRQNLNAYLAGTFPQAQAEFKEVGNLFNLLFSKSEAPLVARLRAVQKGPQNNIFLENLHGKLQQTLKGHSVPPIAWQEHMILKADPVKLLAYDVSFDALHQKIKSAFNENKIMVITENQAFTPVILGGKPQRIRDVLSYTQIENQKGKMIPVRNLLREDKGIDIKTLRAGQEGEFFPVKLDVSEAESESIIKQIQQVVTEDKHFEVSFAGSLFSNREMIRELLIILGISLMLLYFILASQFESLTLPFIVLLEVPIDIFGAFLMLKLFGASINLMSMIGIIVMTGIIINDSILKIDTINQLRSQGYSLLRALALAGQRRLKPILMTSLTTVLALLPFLFSQGLGVDLQKPLALAVIGGMTIGTLVSLYFIPLCYYYLNKGKRKE